MWNAPLYFSRECDMTNPADVFKINLNQNLWGLVVCFGFLGVAEYYTLCVLFWFSAIPSLVMTISICMTTFAYTRNYLENKSS
jgi:hypothetical protein